MQATKLMRSSCSWSLGVSGRGTVAKQRAERINRTKNKNLKLRFYLARNIKICKEKNIPQPGVKISPPFSSSPPTLPTLAAALTKIAASSSFLVETIPEIEPLLSSA